VLVANAEEWSSRSIESILGPEGFAVVRACTGWQAIELAVSARPDVVILDYQLPGLDGIDVCRRMRAEELVSPMTPILLTASSSLGRAQRIEAHSAGAWEVCAPLLDGEVLLLKLHSFAAAAREAERCRAEALLDRATGGYNVRGLMRRAREVGRDAERRRLPVACLVFSPSGSCLAVSDGVPDSVSTLLVRRVAAALGHCSRGADVVGRLGPMEVALIAPGADGEGALRLAERVRAAVSASPFEVGGAVRRVSLYVGYCAVPNFAESPIDVMEMVRRAAAAMRQSAGANDESARACEEIAPTVPR
jgi:diguanylate cyclase (GGDEF)-like protein